MYSEFETVLMDLLNVITRDILFQITDNLYMIKHTSILQRYFHLYKSTRNVTCLTLCNFKPYENIGPCETSPKNQHLRTIRWLNTIRNIMLCPQMNGYVHFFVNFWLHILFSPVN